MAAVAPLKFPSALLGALALAAASAFAAPFENDLLSLEVPSGFHGPSTMEMGPTATTWGFTKPHPGAQAGTFLQISIFDFGSKMPPIPAEFVGPMADHYNAQFLAGVGRRRQSFQAAAPTRVVVGGLPASRITWTGLSEGKGMHGAMYCVVLGSRVVSMHVQDLDDAPAAHFAEAESTIGRMVFKRAGAPLAGPPP